jgi:hypothetical protein
LILASSTACSDGLTLCYDLVYCIELNEMLLNATLDAHAWASARPFYETDLATRKFEQQIRSLQEQEADQGDSPTSPSLLFLVFGRRKFRLLDCSCFLFTVPDFF